MVDGGCIVKLYMNIELVVAMVGTGERGLWYCESGAWRRSVVGIPYEKTFGIVNRKYDGLDTASASPIGIESPAMMQRAQGDLSNGACCNIGSRCAQPEKTCR